MADETDHVSGLAGLTLTITASKDSAAFASISPTVTDRGNGWYNLALTTSHTDTVGDLALHITSTGADPTDVVWEVESNDLYTASVAQTGDNYARLGAPAGASVSADIAAVKTQAAAIETDTQDIQSRLPAALVSGRMDSNVQASASALTFNLTGNISGSVGSVTGAVGSVTGNVGGNVTGSVGSVATGGITSGSLAASAGNELRAAIWADDTAPNGADIALMKAKTDSLTFTTAGMVDSAVKRVGDTTLAAAGTGGQGYGA